MSAKTGRRLALISVLCLLLVICCVVPSVRGFLTSIAQHIAGREVRYFNNEIQADNDDTNNYNFGYDRKAAADAAVKAGKSPSVVDWIARKDGTGDFFYSISVDPALCAAVALHMDETLAFDEKILCDEQSYRIGQRADKAHLHFLSDYAYWDRAIRLIRERLTSGSIDVVYIKKSPKSMMYMLFNGLEGNKPSVIVRNTTSSKGYVVEFDLGKPGKVRFRLNCGYQPIDLGYWPTPGPDPDPDPEPTPTLEPKKPDAGPQAQTQQSPNPDFGGGQNHDNDTTYSDKEPESPETYNPPAPPKAKPTKKPNPTATPKPDSTVVQGDGQDHGDLSKIQEEQHSQQTVEEPLKQEGPNEGDLDEDAVE